MEKDKHPLPEPVQEQDKDTEEKIGEILESLPRDKREKIEQVMISHYAMIRRTSPEGEIAKRITSDHISTMLENDRKSMDYSHRDEWQSKLFYGFIALLAVGGVLAVILLLKDKSESMERIVDMLITAVISGLGGYGFGKYKGKNDD